MVFNHHKVKSRQLKTFLTNDSGVTGGANTGTHTTNKTQLLEIVRLPVAARKELRTVY